MTVNNPDTGDQSLANTVTSATPGSNCPAGGGDARCTVTVTVVAAAALTFTQTAAAPSAVAGGTVAYTITIVNSGGVAATGASFTDPLGGVLDDAAYNGNAVASSGTVTFASPDLSWTGDVPAGGTVTITYTVTVNNPDTGNKILTSTITSPSAGQQLPGRQPRPAVHRHRDHLPADHQFHREHRHHHPGRGRPLHRDAGQHRADPVRGDQRRHGLHRDLRRRDRQR